MAKEKRMVPRSETARRGDGQELWRAVVAAVLVGAAVVAWPLTAPAQVPTLPIGTTTTTTTEPPTTTTTTTEPPPSTTTTLPAEVTTTTAVPQAPPPPEKPLPELEKKRAKKRPRSGDGAPPVEEALEEGRVPAWAIEKMASVPRTGANSTKRVLEALAPLRSIGFQPEEIALIGLGKFPVRGEATFADDWWFPRFTPEFHLHQGTDIFAAFGTPVVAPFDGVLTMGDGPVGGLYTYLTREDGTYYYFAHLQDLPQLPDEQRIEDPAEVARYAFRAYDRPVAYRVSAGDLVGTVGDTGNAKGGPSHLHFEVHPGGGEAVNPKPILDRWLEQAQRQAGELVALYLSHGPKAALATQRTRAAGSGQFAAPSRPLSTEMLGVTAGGPSAGVQVVTKEVVHALATIDWSRFAGAHLARPSQEAWAVLSRFFPPRSASSLPGRI